MVSDLLSRGREFHFRSGRYQVVTAWMGDCLRTGEPSAYITNTKVNSALHLAGVDKSSTIACLAWVKAFIWLYCVIPYGRWRSVALRCVIHKKLYIYIYIHHILVTFNLNHVEYHLKKRLIEDWRRFDQNIIDRPVNQWRNRLRASA